MSRTYDVVVVGAGPAGLMAAKTAAENGLRVALLERKDSITDVQRSCATMFAIEDDYYFGERMYFNEQQQRLVFPVSGFSVPYSGPYKNFYAWHIYTSDARSCVRMGDYDVNAGRGSAGRLSVTYSKKELLETLLHDARQNGADIYTGVNVVDHRRSDSANEVITAEGRVFKGVFTVAADGINSRLVKILGLNRCREFYGTLLGVSYYMSGLSLPHPEAIVFPQLFHQKTQYPILVWIEPSPYGEDEYWVYAGGAAHPDIDYRAELDRCICSSPFSSWFAGASINREQAHVGNMWSPVPDPVVGNVLITGDAGWTVEAECTGSMMSGYRAGHALAEAFRNNRLDSAGAHTYSRWWRHHFAESMDYREFLTIMSGGLLGEDATNYLRSLVTETLPCTLNPYNLIKHMNDALMKRMDRIQAERPDVLKALQHIAALPLEEQMKDISSHGFPNV